MDCCEGLRVLLRLIAEEGGLGNISSTGGTLLEESEKLLDQGEVGNVKSLQDGISGSKPLISKPAFVSKRHTPQLEAVQSTPAAQVRQWNLASNTAAELAVLKRGEGKMRRVRLSSLFPTINSDKKPT
jgi:hypothetical protein